MTAPHYFRDAMRAYRSRLRAGVSLRAMRDPLALTPREREASDLQARGLTRAEIAERMGIAVGTVDRRLQFARDKRRARELAA